MIVSIGDATLVISDLKDQALTHWSLAAVDRTNPGQTPALYHPDGDPGETLELPDNETEMIEAIEKLRRAINRSRPKPGRLRWVGMVASVAVVAALAVFWMPGALRDHAIKVVPEVKRVSLGTALLKRLERVSGPACESPGGSAALSRLTKRLEVGRVAILPDMTRASLHLPGRLIVLDRAVLEDYEEPDVAAGYVLTEDVARSEHDPLRALLEAVGLRENFRLLTTGDISSEALDAYAEQLLMRPAATPKVDAQLARFAKAELRSKPYAFARDITGESTLPLIEGDPMNGKLTAPLMSDADWLRLQSICGG